MIDFLVKFLLKYNINRTQFYPLKVYINFVPVKGVYTIYPFFKVLQCKLYIIRNNIKWGIGYCDIFNLKLLNFS